MKLIRATCSAKRDSLALAQAQSKSWGSCCCCTLDLVQHEAAANACTKVRAHMHNLLIWYQGSACTIGCVMAPSHLKAWPDRPVCREQSQQTKQKSTCGEGNLGFSGDLAWFLVFDRKHYIKWSWQEHNAASRADHHCVPSRDMFGQKEKLIICPRMLQAECKFFQVQAIKTGHILII